MKKKIVITIFMLSSIVVVGWIYGDNKNANIKSASANIPVNEISANKTVIKAKDSLSENKKLYCTINIYQRQFEIDPATKNVKNKSLNYSESIDKFQKDI